MGRSAEQISVLGIIAVLTLTVMSGCSSSKETEKAPPPEDVTLKKYEAGFKPSDYDPEPKGRSNNSGLITGDSPDSTLEPETTSSMELVSGFRVQLLSTTSIDDANSRKAEAELTFPGEWIYVEYDPPTYKVRAGNFQNRIDADRFAKLASSKGFQEAWAVPERVYKQPAPPSKPSPASPGTEDQK